MKYIINSHCFWLELDQLYKLMLKISCYSTVLIESSTTDSAPTKSYRPSSSFNPKLVTMTIYPFHKYQCFRRHCPPNYGLLINCFTISVKVTCVVPSMQASDQYVEKLTRVHNPRLIPASPPTPPTGAYHMPCTQMQFK